MEKLMELIMMLFVVIGVLAFIVSVITQVIKEMPGVCKLQTNAVVLIISLILCPVALLIACEYFKIQMVWYYIIGAVIGAFFVYLVATGGWEKISAMWQRTRFPKEDK